jgi:hypothetical protein
VIVFGRTQKINETAPTQSLSFHGMMDSANRTTSYQRLEDASVMTKGFPVEETATKLLEVIAPATLPAGYVLDVEIEGTVVNLIVVSTAHNDSLLSIPLFSHQLTSLA